MIWLFGNRYLGGFEKGFQCLYFRPIRNKNYLNNFSGKKYFFMALRLNSLVHVVLGEMTYFFKNNYEAKQGHKYKVYLLFLTAPWSRMIFFSWISLEKCFTFHLFTFDIFHECIICFGSSVEAVVSFILCCV